jgi:uncharacterized protein (UPF0333 family)
MKKAQVAMEYLFVTTIILLLSIFVLYDVFDKREQLDNTKEILLKKSLCLSVSSFISEVYTKGTGTEATLKLTSDQLSYPVTIQPISRNLFVGITNAIYCTIPLSSVSNSTDKVDWFRFYFNGWNRALTFKNVDNLVVVSLVENPQ